MNRINKCPYTVFCGSLLEEHRNRVLSLGETIATLQQKNQELTDGNKRNNETIATLQEIIEKLKDDLKRSPQSTKLHQMQLEVGKLENENLELKSNYEVLLMKSASQESDLIEFKLRADYLQAQVASLEEKIENLTIEKEKAMNNYEDKINSFKGFKQQAADLKNTLDKMIIKMATVKAHFQKSNQEKSDLIQERQDLVIRAAAGFENLTPRPNIQQLGAEKNLNLSSLLPKAEKKKKMTTHYVVDNLLNKICEYQAKIAFMDAELRDRRKIAGTPLSSQQSNGPRKTSVSQGGAKTSITQRVVGSISQSKVSKLVNLEMEKKSKFVFPVGTDDEVKSFKDSNTESPPKIGTFDFKPNEIKKEDEEGTNSNTEINTMREKDDVKETENIIHDIIESKKLIEQFEAGK